MATRINPAKGSRPDKLMRDALLVVLHRAAVDADGKPTRRLNTVVAALVNKAISGDVIAIKEIFDRVDGKSPQMLQGDPDQPLTIALIERRIVDKPEK